MARCILMIEDDHEMVTLGKLILERESYKVLPAYDGVEGLKLLEKTDEKIDLVLLDIALPGMSGWQVLESIKSNPRYRHTPVIMLTARLPLEEEEQLAAHSEQYAGYVVKPFVVRELLTTISDLIETVPR
jgi:DNA-binding response OmpR family regulator